MVSQGWFRALPGKIILACSLNNLGGEVNGKGGRRMDRILPAAWGYEPSKMKINN